MLTKHSSAAWGIITSILFVVAVLGVMLFFSVDEKVLRLLAWIDTQGAWAPLLFMLIMAMAVVLLLPGILLTTGAGFVFGVVKGTLYVVIGTTLGAVIAFLIARHLFGERAAHFVQHHARLKLISEELTPQGWKIVMLTRLVPFFPFKLSNYFFGLTAFSLRGFTGGTLVGIIPFSLHNVYLGSIAADIAMLGARGSDRTPLEWSLYGGGFLVAVGIVIYLGRLANRILARYTEEETKGEE